LIFNRSLNTPISEPSREISRKFNPPLLRGYGVTSPFSSNFGVTNPPDTAGKKMEMEYIEAGLMAKRSVH
jgi:hypothetical protein